MGWWVEQAVLSLLGVRHRMCRCLLFRVQLLSMS